MVGLGVALLNRFAPALTANLPAFMRPSSGIGELHGARLRRPWWTTPLLMTFTLVLTFYVIAGLIAFKVSPYAGSPGEMIRRMDHTLLWVALALAALGMVRGHMFNAAARATIGEGLTMVTLATDHPLTQRVHALAARLDLPPPEVGVTEAVNAFAMGPGVDKATVVIGAPLVRNLSRDELDAVIGHELGHIISGDMRRMQYAEGYQRAFAGVFSVIVLFLTMIGMAMAKSRGTAQLGEMVGRGISGLGRLIINLGGELLTKGVSRSREFYADAIGAGLTSPGAMIRALDKLDTIPATPTPTEEDYAYLMFKGFSFGTPFATHPTMAARKEALKRESYLRLLPRRP